MLRYQVHVVGARDPIASFAALGAATQFAIKMARTGEPLQVLDAAVDLEPAMTEHEVRFYASQFSDDDLLHGRVNAELDTMEAIVSQYRELLDRIDGERENYEAALGALHYDPEMMAALRRRVLTWADEAVQRIERFRPELVHFPVGSGEDAAVAAD